MLTIRVYYPAKLNEIIGEWLDDRHELSAMTVIYSQAGCARQDFHTDLQTFVRAITYLVLLAIEEGNKCCVVSQLISNYEFNYNQYFYGHAMNCCNNVSRKGAIAGRDHALPHHENW